MHHNQTPTYFFQHFSSQNLLSHPNALSSSACSFRFAIVVSSTFWDALWILTGNRDFVPARWPVRLHRSSWHPCCVTTSPDHAQSYRTSTIHPSVAHDNPDDSTCQEISCPFPAAAETSDHHFGFSLTSSTFRTIFLQFRRPTHGQDAPSGVISDPTPLEKWSSALLQGLLWMHTCMLSWHRSWFKHKTWVFCLISIVSRHWSLRLALTFIEDWGLPPTLFHPIDFMFCCNFHSLPWGRPLCQLRPKVLLRQHSYQLLQNQFCWDFKNSIM